MPLSRISHRIASLTESATLAIDAQAKAMTAAGQAVLNFGAGEPDFPTPPHIVEAAIQAAKDPRNHRYSPVAGLPELREALAAQTARDAQYTVDPSQVLVTNGGKQAIDNILTTLLDPGDEVLLPAPYWTTYPELIQLAGGIPVPVFAESSQQYLVNVEQLEAACSPRTKILLFTSPSNPTGAVYSPEQVRTIGLWAAQKGLWVVSDEIYQHFVYDAMPFTSMGAAVPELHDRFVLLNGVAKSFAMTGWRVGWTVGPHDIIRAATNLQSHTTSHVSNITQRAALAAVAGPLDAVVAMKEAFDRRRRTIVAGLQGIPSVRCPTPLGAFYVYVDVLPLLQKRKLADSRTLAQQLLQECQLAAVPGEAFGRSGYLRFSYALGDAELLEGIQRLQHYLCR